MTDALRQRIKLLGSQFADATARNELRKLITEFLHNKTGDNTRDDSL